MVFSFRKEVITFLKDNKNKYYTAREITEHIVEQYPEACEEKMKNSKGGYLKTKNDCIHQWVAEIGAYKESFMKKGISMTAGRPRKYYYLFNKKEEVENASRRKNQPEKELYSVLAKYCNSINIKTLRIDEKESKKDKGKNYNKCLIEYADERSYLYSFEVKSGTIET